MAKENKSAGKVPNRVPRLRFPGFEGEWKTKKVRECCIINPKNENLPDSFIYIDLESVVNGHLLKEEKVFKDEAPSRAQRRLIKSDILFQMVRPYQKNNLYFDKGGDYVASTGYAQIRTLQNSQFIFQYLHNQNFVDKVIERCTGTSYPAINSSDLGNIEIYHPEVQEQNKIATFLELLDNRIQAQNKIIEQLESLMDGLGKKLFRQKIRFKDEQGKEFPNWEIKKLKEVCIEHQLKNRKNENNEVFSVAKHKGVINQIEHLGRSFSAKDIGHYKLIYPGDLVYTKSPTSDFPFGIIKQNRTGRIGVVSPLYCVFKPKTFALGYLLHEYFNSSINTFNYLSPLVQKGAKNTMNINNNDFLNGAGLLICTNEQEQTSIMNFFESIYSKIEIEKKLLKQCKTQKQYLLQNLFI